MLWESKKKKEREWKIISHSEHHIARLTLVLQDKEP